MSSKKEIPERVGTQGWEQFLGNKHGMLAKFETAKRNAKGRTIQVSHGPVAEAAFREWLSSFLPKKYAVTSGYIISQNMNFSGHKFPHYDVIIYDELNSPVLWIDENNDHSEVGKARAIPAEYVKAVFEVKANLTVETSADSMKKLRELIPLTSNIHYPELNVGKLPLGFMTGIIFFELQKENENKVVIMDNLIGQPDLPYYGGIILRAESRHGDDTGLFRLTYSDEPIPKTETQDSLITGFYLPNFVKMNDGKYYGTNLTWSPVYFSMFAFDIIALLEGRYKPGYTSSWYGMSWLNPDKK